MYLLYTASNLYYKKKYTDMLNKKITGKCVSGCKQGICNRGISCKDYFPFNEECCSFNFECKGCADIYDNHIYEQNESEEVYQSPGRIMKLNSYACLYPSSAKRSPDKPPPLISYVLESSSSLLSKLNRSVEYNIPSSLMAEPIK